MGEGVEEMRTPWIQVPSHQCLLVHSSPRVDFGEANFPSLNIFQNVSLPEFLYLKKLTLWVRYTNIEKQHKS